MKPARQLPLPLPRRGGKRPGAGRKPKGARALVSHRARARFDKPTPVHVTLRVREHVWNLRSRRSFGRIRDCFEKSCGRFGARLVEFSVQGNHLHLIVEADGNEALSRALQGLCIRLARALNAMMKRTGAVFADHYHSRLLKTPTELVNAIRYVLGNAARHFVRGRPLFGGGARDGGGGARGLGGEGTRVAAGAGRLDGGTHDPFSSAGLAGGEGVLAKPLGWLLRVGWKRASASRSQEPSR